MVSARRGWGTLGPLQCKVFVCLCPGDPAPSGPPLGPLRRSVVPPVCAGVQAPGEPILAPAARRPCLSTLRGPPVGHHWGP